MPLSQWNLEFLNHNAQRSYPLTADSTKTDTTGSFTIPSDFLVGIDLPVSTAQDMESGNFFIRQLGLFASGVQLIFSYSTATSIVDVATCLVPAFAERNQVFTVGGIEPFDDIVGKVVVGKLSTLLKQPTGLFEFDIDDTRIEPQAIRPMIRGITSLSVLNAGGTPGERLYGDIELVAGANIQLQTINTATESKIIISAIDGEGTIDDCLCEGEAAALPCIKTINGIAPTVDGNFNFVGDACLDFVGTDSGISLTDECCTPCCGCEELETITRELERFNAQRGSLDLFVNTLATEQTTFSLTVLGSRVGDRKCLTCE